MKNRIFPDSETKDFLNLLLEERRPHLFYSEIRNRFSERRLAIDSSTDLPLKNSIYIVTDIPDYLQAKSKDTTKGWKSKILDTYQGSLIALCHYNSAQDYFQQNFSSNRRSKFRSYKKRLEHSFDINYQIFYGDISREKYDELFACLKIMVESRFRERKQVHHDVHRWSWYYEITFPLILKKEAVLFVIYDGQRPISICFNLIYDKIMFAFLRSFDIDYSKFYLGFIDFRQQIDWCYEQGFEIFDLLKGRYAYKNRLVDTTYYFQKQVIYNSNKANASFLAGLIYWRTWTFYTLIRFLKNFKVHLLYHELLNWWNGKKFGKQEIPDYKIRKLPEIPDLNNLLKLDSDTSEIQYLRRPIYDYLYTMQEALKDVQIYKDPGEKNRFLAIGAKGQLEIVLQKPINNA